ncbi:hypothetical protein GMORB2_5986 [Geosmithia morbida]|uniref:Integral membrane bound transporter domain-containing protein n=1 Tax=Geosmithia morbida TaxID=1094350 RepID=A0A9P4YYA1_9HYPO|nr:uncharacterized protein GMORB2_5986 [Geosmithia morbida]KAF4124270.1 hypothetical protein GMORB2_5986 [Geosmithia morbida]
MPNGTFIIPSTGERSRRQFTLRGSSSLSFARHRSEIREAAVETFGERAKAAAHNTKDRAVALAKWFGTEEGHTVLKCTFAYLLGSCGTFVPPLSNFLGHRDGKHISATITVYFHPARTVGSMIEAVLTGVCAVLYAEIVAWISMGIVAWGRHTLDNVLPAHALILVFCIGGGLGFVGWVKQRLNRPLVNVATTLASISIITVVTKEESVQDGFFSAEKPVQMLKLLILGIASSAAVNLLVWRHSARRELREDLGKASLALSDRLSFITRGFLAGIEEEVNSPEYSAAMSSYDKAYSHMTNTLHDVKNEHYVCGREKIYDLDKKLVKGLETVSQAIGGLRSALDTQLVLLKEAPPATPQPSSLRGPLSPTADDVLGGLAVIAESDERADGTRSPPRTPPPQSDLAFGRAPLFRSPSDIFTYFLDLLGPSMKSFAFTLSEMLRESSFGEDPMKDINVNDQLRESLGEALTLYKESRAKALREFYRTIEMGRSRSQAIEADIEEVAAACGHFSSSLQAVAEELGAYLDTLDYLKYMTENSRRTWHFLKFWRKLSWPFAKKTGVQLGDPEEHFTPPPPPAVTGPRRSAMPKGIPDEMIQRRDVFNWEASPQASAILRSVSQKVLRMARQVMREDVLFGIKVGIGAILWAQFAFIPSTRPIYQTWRGEWGLLSYMIVNGMTTGAANTTGLSRFYGTIIGGACACLAWIVGQENPFLLAFCGWLMALGNFYLITIKNAPLGRMSLLAYNVIVLYAYSISQQVDDDDDDEGGTSPLIFDIAFHRLLSVTLGIIWGILVCRVLWPISARRKFREGLPVLYLQLGLIWKRGPLGTKLASEEVVDYMREGEQMALQKYVSKLETLRGSAQAEFELRGPFPYAAYGRIMRSTRRILNGFYAMRVLTQKRSCLSEGERAILEFTIDERAQLCERICHIFQVLASCIMLEYPLTDAIPTVDSSKDRLLNKIYQFRREHTSVNQLNGLSSPEVGGGATAPPRAAVYDEEDYALLYAYTLVTGQVAEELKKVRREIEELFGVLGENSLLLQ